MADVAEPELLLERVQQLSEQLDELPDPRARELASELVSAVIAMYGDGLERIVAAIEEAGEAAAPDPPAFLRCASCRPVSSADDPEPAPLPALDGRMIAG